MQARSAAAPRRRVLFIHPSLQTTGGGTGVTAWMLQALAGRCDLALLSLEPADLLAVNRAWGTTLAAGDLAEIVPDTRLWRLLARVPTPLSMLKLLLLYRHGRALAGGYDLLVAAKDEADLGAVPGLQYVHFPWTYYPRPGADRNYFRPGHRWVWGYWLRVVLYHAACRVLTGFSMRRMRRNVTLVNSHWTGELYARRHPAAPPAEVLYPPVAGAFAQLPWERREDAFLAIGRLSLEKRFEEIVDILQDVRSRGHAVRLSIAGLDDGPTPTALAERFTRHGAWITVHHNLGRVALAALIARHRYGIHANPREPFGMAVAELVAGGCLVFTPDRGGVTEIVRDPRLHFASRREAVEKICHVLGAADASGADAGSGLVAELRCRLAADLPDLSTASFASRIRQLAGVP